MSTACPAASLVVDQTEPIVDQAGVDQPLPTTLFGPIDTTRRTALQTGCRNQQRHQPLQQVATSLVPITSKQRSAAGNAEPRAMQSYQQTNDIGRSEAGPRHAPMGISLRRTDAERIGLDHCGAVKRLLPTTRIHRVRHWGAAKRGDYNLVPNAYATKLPHK
jgi:hypothetical protein